MILERSARLTGLAYLAPALLFTGLFVIWPLWDLILLSFTDESLLGGGTWVGLENYTDAFGDRNFWRAFWFTLQYTLCITPVLMALGFGLALLTLHNSPMTRLTRAVVFIPVVIGLASSSLLWLWLFNQQVGLVNDALVSVGVLDEPMVWFNKPNPAMAAVIFSVVWKVVGFGMIIMLSGMQSISQEVIEASMIDGASYWQRVRRVIIPLSIRSILLATLISAIGSMLAFDQFYLMTGGAPRGQTFTSVYWIYQNSFIYFKLGYGAALSLILMAVIMAGTALQLWLQSRGGRG